MKRLLEIKELTAVVTQNDEELLLTENEWKRLEQIVHVLRHPYHVTQLLQRSNLTLSDFYAAWLELKFVLQEIHDTDSTNKLAANILNAMNADKHEHLIRNPLMQCSIFLDPRVKNDLLRNSERNLLARLNLTKLYERFTQSKNNTIQPFGALCDLDSSDEKITSYSNLTRYMSILDCSNPHPESSDTTTKAKPDIAQLLDDFSKTKAITMSVSVLDYWEENKLSFPELYELAKIVFSVPLTETSVRHTFSALKFVFSELKGNYADEFLEDIMIIKLNKDLFYEIASEELEQTATS